MAKKKDKRPAKPAVQAKPGVSPISGTPPPAEHQFQPGVSGNPEGRPKNAGSSIREWLNAMAEWTQQEVEKVLGDDAAPMGKRIAATRIVAALVEGDDFDRICDRTEGRPTQRMDVEHGGKFDTPADGEAGADQAIARLNALGINPPVPPG